MVRYFSAKATVLVVIRVWGGFTCYKSWRTLLVDQVLGFGVFWVLSLFSRGLRTTKTRLLQAHGCKEREAKRRPSRDRLKRQPEVRLRGAVSRLLRLLAQVHGGPSGNADGSSGGRMVFLRYWDTSIWINPHVWGLLPQEYRFRLLK